MIEAIRSNGWLQGSIFDVAAHARLQPSCSCELSPDDCCIVLSQSCDIACPDFDAEPVVEVVVAKRIDRLIGNFTHSKSTRRLHLPIIVVGKDIPHEVQVRHRFTIPRQILSECKRDPNRILSQAAEGDLIHWIVARYSRTAFPDEFNIRTSSTIDKKIKPQLVKLHRLKAIYVALIPWEELGEADSYAISLLGTMNTEDYGNLEYRTDVESGLAQIVKELAKCKGITVDDYAVQPESEVTLDVVRTLARWNFDYISLRDPGQHVMGQAVK